MPKINAELSNDDLIIITEGYHIYSDIEHEVAFQQSFYKLHKEKKLSLALEHIDYSPFIRALNEHSYKFFLDLVHALPKEEHKKLLLLHNNSKIIKCYISSLLNDPDNDSAKIKININKLLFDTLPETMKEVSGEYILELYAHGKVDEEDYNYLLTIFDPSIYITENDSTESSEMHVDDTEQHLAGQDSTMHDDSE